MRKASGIVIMEFNKGKIKMLSPRRASRKVKKGCFVRAHVLLGEDWYLTSPIQKFDVKNKTFVTESGHEYQY